MRRTAAGLFGIAVLAAIAVVLSRSDVDDRPTDGEGSSSTTESATNRRLERAVRGPIVAEDVGRREEALAGHESVASDGTADDRGDESWFVGRVLDAQTDQPIAFARVIVPGLSALVGDDPLVIAVTDRDGSFRTEPFPRANSTQNVIVVAPESVPTRFESVPIVAGRNTRDFRVDRGGFVTVLVLDVETGAPTPGVTIYCDAFAHELEIAETGSDGRARIRGVTGTDRAITIAARRSGYFGTRRFLTAPPETSGTELEFRVGRECRVEAVGLDVAGSPAGGSLQLHFGRLLSSSQLTAALPFTLPEGLELEYRWTSASYLGRSDRVVLAELPPLPISEVWLQVENRVRRFVSVRPFTACGQLRRADFATAEVRDPAAFFGRLTMNGAPTGATAWWEIGEVRREFDLVANENGEYRVDDVPTGIVAWTMRAKSTGETRRSLLGIGAGQVVRADFDFVRDGSRLAGVVVDGKGEPMPGVVVQLRTATPTLDSREFESMTDSAGSFEFRGLVDGASYRIEARSSEFPVGSVEAPSGRVDVRIRLGPDGP